MTRRFHFLLTYIFLFLFASTLFAEPLNTPAKTTMMLQWTPQSQFAGYYAAVDQGYYKSHGVEMKLLRGGPDRDQVKALKNKDAEFATFFLTGALTYMDEGLPLIHLVQVVNKSNLVLVAWKNHGIDEITDLKEKKISLWGKDFSAPYMSLFEASGFMPKIIPQYYSVNVFLNGGADGCSAMYYNEYQRIYLAGIDNDQLSIFFLADYGIHIPEDGIYCTNEIFKNKPDLCKAVVEASMEGWQFVHDNPEEALDIVMQRVISDHVPTNRTHMKWMLDVILPTIYPDKEENWETGNLSEEDYKYTTDMLLDFNIIKSAPSYKEFTAGLYDE